jgi:hypothetical protein
MEHGSERYIAQICRCAVIPDDAVGQHGKWTGRREAEDPCGLNAKAAPAVHVIREDEFTTVGLRFFQGRELSGFGAERFIGGGVREQQEADAQAIEKVSHGKRGFEEALKSVF